jgi:serine/threonine protein kinase
MQAGDVLLGKFRVERLLGRGGMGVVVAARHVELDELFAIKLMHPESLSNPEAIERFVREARAAARLKGEHVARVHDVGRLENGAPYMLMEHLTGDDLSQLLDKRGALPVREAALYVMQACEAIAEAHGHGIVHRDLKPANLFLTSRANGSPCVKVLDFGISKKIDPAKKFGRTLTVTGAFLGSPAFMSPEQMLNGKSADTRTDIWALGTILYELTTGAVPFNGETMTELVARVMNEPATPPSALRPTIPRTFDTLVLTCLQKKPARRFQTIEELMAALRPFMTEDNPRLKQAMPALSLPRVHDDPDSERAANIIDVPPLDLNAGASPLQIDNGPDSEAATRVLEPPPRVVDKPRLPSAMDADFFTTTSNTVEMPTQIHRPSVVPLKPEPDVVTTQPDELPLRRSSSRMVLYGVAIFGVIILAAFYIMWLNDPPPVDKAEPSPSADLSAVPETTVTPMASASSRDIAPAPSAAPSAKATNSAKTPRSSPLPNPALKPKPKLY